MTHARPAWPAGLARKWLAAYNRFAFLAQAARERLRNRWPAGDLRGQLTAAADRVVTLADQLRAVGYAPQAGFAGHELELWERAARYVAALPVGAGPADAAWDRFAGFVAGLPDDAFADLAALRPAAFRPDGLAALLGHRVVAPAAGQPVGQPLGDGEDEPAVVAAGV